jgi:hypothetical protein
MKIEFKKYPEIENYLSEQIHRWWGLLF